MPRDLERFWRTTQQLRRFDYGPRGTTLTQVADQGYAPLASPVFTGDPQAPTAAPGDSDTSIATTAYVQAAIAVAAPVPLPIARGGTNATTAPGALVNLGAAPIASPVFTGDPRAPTPTTADNDTSVATTAYVQAQGYATSTAMTTADNLRVLKAGDTMTGALTATALTASGNASAVNYVLGAQTTATVGNFGFINGNGPYIGMAGTAAANPGQILISAAAGILVGGTIAPTTNNALYLGYGGASWLSVSSYAYVNASDPSLKTAIESAPPALEAVLALDPKTYRWRDGPDTERRHHGFLAPDVATVLGDGFGGYSRDPDSGTQGLAYHELTAVLWRAVQELAGEVAVLKRLAAVLVAVLWSGAALAQNSNVNPVPGSLWTYLGSTYGAGWTVGSGIYGAVPTAIGHPAVWSNTAGTALNMPDRFQMTPSIAAVAGDSPANSAIWVNATRTGTATGSMDNGLLMLVHAETMTDTVTSRGIDTVFVDHAFGVGEGSRSGIFVNLRNTAATANPTSTHEFYTAVFGNVVANVTDSPTGGIKGDFYALAGQTTISAGVKAHGAVGAEVDVGVQAGASVAEKIMLGLVLYNSDAVRGTNVDAGISMSRQPSATATLAAGIEFGKPGYVGSWLFDANSTIINARGSADTPAATAGNGVNFSLVSFTGCAFASKGFCVADGAPGILLQRPFPTIDFWDTQIAAPTTHGGVVRLASTGSTQDSYTWQINTAASGDFSTGITAYTVDSNGTFITNQAAIVSKGVAVGGGAPGAAPPGNYYALYTDTADNKLKAMSSTGVVTVLASP